MNKFLNYLKMNVHIFVVLLIALIGLIVGSFKDFDISKALYNTTDPGNVFTILVAGFAEFPCYLFCVFGGIGLIVSLPECKKGLKIFAYIIGIIAIAIATGLGAKTCAEYLSNFKAVEDFATLLKILGIAITVLCAGAIVVVMALKGKKLNKEQLFKVSIFLITITATFILFSNVIKYCISRPRPLLVFNSENPLETYEPWYIPHFLQAFKMGDAKDLYKSCPSGHTGSAAVVCFALPALFTLFNKTNTKKFMVIGVYTGLLFTLIIALGRILCGAHFLSDVSLGALLVCIEILIINAVFKKIFSKKEEINE